jgi:Tol biopolymer transport system component
LTRDSSDAEPQGSPNGRWIVFVRSVDEPFGSGTFPARHIFRARSNGTAVTEVTDGPVFDRTPSFAPSGRRILFSRTLPDTDPDQPSEEHIFSVRLDGTGLHQITSGPGSDRNPVFSPTGRLIAFDRFLEGHTRHVYTMRPDGSRVRDATPDLAAWSSQADFSPSGHRIVFVRGFPGDERTADLFTMRPDGKLRRRLTGRPHHPHGGLSNPAYSPDGRLVVSQFELGFSFSKLQVFRVGSGALVKTIGGRRLARTPDVRDPVWLPR